MITCERHTVERHQPTVERRLLMAHPIAEPSGWSNVSRTVDEAITLIVVKGRAAQINQHAIVLPAA